MSSIRKKVKKVDTSGKSAPRLSAIFGFLGDLYHYRIVSSLYEHKMLTVQDIAKVLNTTNKQSLRYLNKLESDNILLKGKKGTVVYYLLNPDNRNVSVLGSLFK
jgi:transcription initiation factor IIE alpha subunit